MVCYGIPSNCRPGEFFSRSIRISQEPGTRLRRVRGSCKIRCRFQQGVTGAAQTRVVLPAGTGAVQVFVDDFTRTYDQRSVADRLPSR